MRLHLDDSGLDFTAETSTTTSTDDRYGSKAQEIDAR